MHELLLDVALDNMRLDDVRQQRPASKAVLSFDQLIPAYRLTMRAGPHHDKLGDTETGCQLVGTGHPVRGQKLVGPLQLLAALQEVQGVLEPYTADTCTIDMHSQASNGSEVLWSRMSQRVKSRFASQPAVSDCEWAQ